MTPGRIGMLFASPQEKGWRKRRIEEEMLKVRGASKL